MMVYICGPVSGMAGHNVAAFHEAKAAIEAAGHGTFCPVDEIDPGLAHHEAMPACIRALLDCDGVALLDGHDLSIGAGVEKEVARVCGKPVLPWRAWAGEVTA